MNSERSLDIKGDFAISLFLLEMSWLFVTYKKNLLFFFFSQSFSLGQTDITKGQGSRRQNSEGWREMTAVSELLTAVLVLR